MTMAAELYTFGGGKAGASSRDVVNEYRATLGLPPLSLEEFNDYIRQGASEQIAEAQAWADAAKEYAEQSKASYINTEDAGNAILTEAQNIVASTVEDASAAGEVQANIAAGYAQQAQNIADTMSEQVLADYRGSNAERLALTGMTAGQTFYVIETDHIWRWSGTSWVDLGEGVIGGIRQDLNSRITTSDSVSLQVFTDISGKVAGVFDASGDLSLQQLDGDGVASRLKRLERKIKESGGGSGGSGSTSEVSLIESPMLRKSTDAELRIHDIIDMVGDYHIAGLDGGVAENIRGLNRRTKELARSVGGGSGGSGSIAYVDAVADLGCDPNGVESVSSKIQAATNQLSLSTSGPSVIFMPRGYWRTTAPIVPKKGVSIIAYDRDRSVFLPTGINAAFEFKGGSGNYLEDCVFANFSVDGQNQTLNPDTGNYNVGAKAFYLQRFRNCLFTDIVMTDTGATSMGIDFADGSIIQRVIARGGGRLATVGDLGGSGIGIGTGEQAQEPLLIVDTITEDCRNYGIFMERQIGSNASHTIIAHAISRRNQWGIGDCGTQGTIIADSQITDNLSHGITMHRGTNNASHAGSKTIITSNRIRANGGAGIDFDASYSPQRDTHAYTSTANRIEENVGAGHKILGPTVGGNHTRRELTINGDVISRNDGAGIDFIGGQFDYVSINHPTIVENTGAGIQLEGAIRTGRIQGASIWDNRETKTQTESIVGAVALTDFDISEVHGVGCSPINLTGTKTRVTYGRNAGV